MADAAALDRLIDYLSPRWGLARARARLMAQYLRDYDAAAKGRRTDSWRSKATSANTEVSKGLALVRDRHREMRRNNPWVERAITVIGSETVKYGIAGEVQHADPARRKLLNGYWKRWSESTVCDAEGQLNFAGLQALIMNGVVEGGDILIRRRRRRPDDDFEIPLQLQVLEGDYLDHTRTETLTNGKIVQGIELDPIGRRRSYHMYRDHPGDLLGSRFDTTPVPASEVAHVYRVDRPGQMRGIPWGVSSYITIRDLDGFEDAYLLRQKLANCVMAFVYDHSPSIGGGSEPAKLPLPETLEPGTIAGLPAGKDVKFAEPPKADSYAPYTGAVLYRIAAAYGISFEALTGDLSKVNFTSGRMGRITMLGNVERWRWHMLIPMALEQVARWFFEALELTGVNVSGASMVWTPPRTEMLNPAQEVPAMTNAVRAGLWSLPEAQRELGYDSDQVLTEISETNAKLDELGLVLDSDPRRTSAAGLSQAAMPPADPDEDDDPEDDEEGAKNRRAAAESDERMLRFASIVADSSAKVASKVGTMIATAVKAAPPAQVTVNVPPAKVDVAPTQVTVPPAQVRVEPTIVNVPPAQVVVQSARPMEKVVERDSEGLVSRIVEQEIKK